MQEFEGVFLAINKKELEEKLEVLGAEKIGDFLFHSTSFDFEGLPLDSDHSWVRLRDDGDVVMLAFKKRLGVTDEIGNDSGMIEHEITVSDFDTTVAILKSIGMIEKFSQEQKRTSWKLDDVTFDFDTRPMLDTYLEIESTNDEKVDGAATKLGLNVEDKKILSATQIYSLAGIRDKDYTKIAFNECIKR